MVEIGGELGVTHVRVFLAIKLGDLLLLIEIFRIRSRLILCDNQLQALRQTLSLHATMRDLTWRAGAAQARVDARRHCRPAGAAKERMASIINGQSQGTLTMPAGVIEIVLGGRKIGAVARTTTGFCSLR
jgi:hypothetical protein